MNQNELMSKLFGFSAPTYFRWKKEERPIIQLLEKYFDKTDLEEFILRKKISRLDNINSSDTILFSYTTAYHQFFTKIYNNSLFEDYVKDTNTYKSTLVYNYFKFLQEEDNNIFSLIDRRDFNVVLLKYFFTNSNLNADYLLSDDTLKYLTNMDEAMQHTIYLFFSCGFKDYHEYKYFMLSSKVDAFGHKLQYDFFLNFENGIINEDNFKDKLVELTNHIKKFQQEENKKYYK